MFLPLAKHQSDEIQSVLINQEKENKIFKFIVNKLDFDFELDQHNM